MDGWIGGWVSGWVGVCLLSLLSIGVLIRRDVDFTCCFINLSGIGPIAISQ